MLRVRMMQPWFALSDPVVEGVLCEIASLRSFARRMHQVEKGNQWLQAEGAQRFPFIRLGVPGAAAYGAK